MKKIFLTIIGLCSLLLMTSCQKDVFSFGALVSPSNVTTTADVVGKTTAQPNGDGSGKVKFTTTADNAISYQYIFGDGITETVPSGVIEHRFTTVGVNTYSVTVIASGRGGVSSTSTIDVTVLSNFTDDKSTQYLTGGTATGKKWYVAANEVGHLGVGPNNDVATDNYYAKWYQAAAFEKKSTCFYDGVLTFALVNGRIQYQLDNKGNTFFNNSYKSVAGGTNGGDDLCLPFATTGVKTVSLSPSSSFVSKNPNAAKQTTGTVMNFSDGGFMGYYAGATEYEILSISENHMVVRFVQANNTGLAWYQIFTTTNPNAPTDNTDYTNLVWSDEFNTDGAPDPAKWAYDTGAGGWGNQEEQYYTNRTNNAVVQSGSLKITAIKESYMGSNYTSARLKTQGLYDFQYGKIEIRAKMPTGAGTWPAAWALGSTNVTWPANGEIDFMEFKGSNPSITQSALHYPNHSGGNADVKTTPITNPTDFHIYTTIWSAQTIRFYLDGNLYYTFDNSSAALPYHAKFYLLLNMAMGGTFGGTIDSGFTQSTMEVDYIKVYQ